MKNRDNKRWKKDKSGRERREQKRDSKKKVIGSLEQLFVNYTGTDHILGGVNGENKK